MLALFYCKKCKNTAKGVNAAALKARLKAANTNNRKGFYYG